MPLVSVIMATYNELPDVVCAAINSILEQTYDNFEFFVMDDSTSQATIRAIDSFSSDNRLTIVRQREQMRKSRARNIGLERARGKYIAIMDGDDISLPERLEKQVAFLENNGDVYMVGGQVSVMNAQGNVISFRKFPQSNSLLSIYAAFKSPLAQPAVLMRRELVDAGFRYDESLDHCEDLDFILKVMAGSYKIANLGDVILKYRVSDDFVARRTERDDIQAKVSVRRKNFDRSHLLRSCLSLMVAWAYTHMPVELIGSLYRAVYKCGRQ